MDYLFATVTVLLSPEFVEAERRSDILSKLRKLRLVTGVQFRSCRANKTFALHGTWSQVTTSFELLSHWKKERTHEPTVQVLQNNGEAENIQLCTCWFVAELLSKLDKVSPSQSETESREETVYARPRKATKICIHTAAVRKDIENLRAELSKSQKKEVKSNDTEKRPTCTGSITAKRTRLNACSSVAVKHKQSLKPGCATKSSKYHKFEGLESHCQVDFVDYVCNKNNIGTNSSLSESSGDCGVILENLSNSQPEQTNTHIIDENIKETIPKHVSPKTEHGIFSEKLVSKTATEILGGSENNSDNRSQTVSSEGSGANILNMDVESMNNSDISEQKKQKRKPGDKGYWSRVKRNDLYLEHQCTLCGVVLKSRKRYFEHKRRIHLKEYKCPTCQKGFGYPTDLKRHVCPASTGSNSKSKLKLPRKVKVNGESLYKCSSCDFKTSSQASLDSHIKKLHEGSTKHQCLICRKTFAYVQNLTQHMKTVHKQTYFMCEKCSKMYKSKVYLDMHLKTHEAGYKPVHKCQYCGKVFSTKYAMNMHTKSEHLGMKQTYLCQICGKKFKQRNSYKQHTNAHLGIQPYQCDICGKSFTYLKSLKEHLFMHDNVRRFECKTCGKSFRQPTTLYIHQKTHKLVKDHACSVCGKDFSQKQALERHERIHSGIRPYKCMLCQKEFGDASTIRRHMIALHRKSESNWRESILCSLKKKTDYYVLGGPGQHRTYGSSSSTSDKPSDRSDAQGLSEEFTDAAKHPDESLKKCDTLTAKRVESDEQTEDSFPKILSSSLPMQVQIPNSAGNSSASGHNAVMQNMVPSETNFVLPNSALPIQNSTIQLQGGSIQIQGNLGHILDLSNLSFLAAKPTGQSQVIANPKAPVPSDEQYYYMYQPSQLLDVQSSAPNQGLGLGKGTFLHLTSASDNLKASPATTSTSMLTQTAAPADSVVNPSAASVWGIVGYPSYYTPGSAVQYVPTSSQQT